MQKLHFLINEIPSIKVKFNYKAQISFMITFFKSNCSNYLVLYLMKNTFVPIGTIEFQAKSWWKSWRGFDPLKFIVILKQAKELLNCQIGQVLEADQNYLVAVALSEAICILSKAHRLKIPYTKREWARWGRINRRQVMVPAECIYFPHWSFSLRSL